jgi:hypothetical protein
MSIFYRLLYITVTGVLTLFAMHTCTYQGLGSGLSSAFKGVAGGAAMIIAGKHIAHCYLQHFVARK